MDAPLPRLTAIPPCLEEVGVKGLPPTVYYISDFITPEEELILLNKVCEYRLWHRPTRSFQLTRLDAILTGSQDRYCPQTSLEAAFPETTANLAIRSLQGYPPRKPPPKLACGTCCVATTFLPSRYCE